MARKVKEIKSKIRIISERVRQEFKEIKQEKEEQEESLEEEILPDEPEEFEDFSAATAPVLETIPDVRNENLERELANAPSAKKEETSEFKYETGVYNMPDYGANTEQRETRERGMEIKDLSEFRQRERDVLDLRSMERENFSQSGEQRIDEDIRKYQEVKEIKEQEERRFPEDRRERKRERVLK